ncbi:MAG: hypothetical protein V2A79_10760 [Planctomycetota bacterium]
MGNFPPADWSYFIGSMSALVLTCFAVLGVWKAGELVLWAAALFL